MLILVTQGVNYIILELTMSGKKNNKIPNISTPPYQALPSKSKSTLISIVFFTGITLSSYVQRLICQNRGFLSQELFGLSALIHQSQRLTVLKQAILYMAILEFFIAFLIINLRIFGQKISPVAEKDPLSISLLNRILSNNLEQAFVFFGLYCYLLFGNTNQLQEKYVLSLPLIFLIGRVVFNLGYILGTVTGIPTLRSFGFAFSVSVNAFMLLELILNLSDIYQVFLFG